MTAKMQAHEQTITSNYNYHIVLTTDQGAFTYTNVYTTPATNPPVITVSLLRFSKFSIRR